MSFGINHKLSLKISKLGLRKGVEPLLNSYLTNYLIDQPTVNEFSSIHHSSSSNPGVRYHRPRVGTHDPHVGPGVPPLFRGPGIPNSSADLGSNPPSLDPRGVLLDTGVRVLDGTVADCTRIPTTI